MKTPKQIVVAHGMILGRALALLGVAWLGVGSIYAAPQQPSSPPSAGAPYRAVLNRYCVLCHNDKLKTAQLTLETIDVEHPASAAETWEKVVRKLRTGAMPPPRLPRPDAETYDAFTTYLETAIDREAMAKPNPGRPVIHRLNRAEYANALRDLLAVNVDGESLLPADDSGYGFDNVGAVLTVSPTLLERYLSAAHKVSRLAVGDRVVRPGIETYEVPKLLLQTDRMDERLPLGSRGGMAFTHNFPVDGEYLIKTRLLRDGNGTIRGVALPRKLDLRLDGARLNLFTVGGEQKGKVGNGFSPEYLGDAAQEEYERNGADAALEVRVPVKAGPHEIGVAFVLEQTSKPEGVFRPAVLGANAAIRGGRTTEPWIDTVAIHGPYGVTELGETPSRRRVFVCHPKDGPASESRKIAGSDSQKGEEDACARKILSTLAHRAFRRPVNEEEVQALLGFYRMGRKQGGFEQGIRMAIERMLVSVNFLFRVESDPPKVAPDTNYRISDLELASRLSFFLWSSIPDDQLLSLAENGKLKDQRVLDRQVRRMLSDPRSEALLNNFFGQWLQLRRVPGLTPDPVEYASFDESLRQAFQKETELFLKSMVREDHPVTDLLDANYTFLNERLARHYGVPNIYGSRFRRVMLSDGNRQGLLGQGSILTETSYATRTSVVLRGVWVLDNLLGTPPPAPPPGVPSLKERGEDGKILSVRQSMEEHRANPVCATCHARIDPIGFALENFDGIGRWRTTEGSANTPIDTSGVLPDGTKFQGPAELRKILLSKPEQFTTVITEKLLTYGLGRGVEYYDEPQVRRIVRESAPDSYRWSSLILGIVRSEPFQMRRSLQP
jgi:mono/diheme cytochrome c family protein